MSCIEKRKVFIKYANNLKKHIDNTKKWINEHTIFSICTLLFVSILIGSILQYVIVQNDLSANNNCKFIIWVYQTLILKNSLNILIVVDGCAFIVGGLSFFLEKWADKDSENVVYLLIVVFALAIAHMLYFFTFSTVTFFMTVAVIILLIFPMVIIIKDNLQNSKKRNIRYNTAYLEHKWYNLGCIEVLDEAQAILFLNKDVILGDATKYTLEDILDFFAARYNHEFLKQDFLNDINIYDVVIKNLEELFEKKQTEKKQLALLLSRMVKDYFDIFDYDSVKQLIAAILIACFECLKESKEYFIEAFCDFNSNKNTQEAFCRLLIVSAIENYCRNRRNDLTPWHESIICFNGDVIQNEVCRRDYFYIVKNLWLKWGNRKQLSQHMDMISIFLEYDNYSKTSIYRTCRTKSENNFGNLYFKEK